MKDLATKAKAVMPWSVRQGFGRLGSFFSADLTYPSVALSLRNLGRLGFQPRFTVDVGAYHGEWAALCKSLFPATRILMLEAQPGKEPKLRDVATSLGPDVDLRVALLGPEDGREVSFHEMETGSSVFEETSPTSRQVRTLTTKRLDTILAEQAAPVVDLLKLDVQGYELEVLKGAPNALAQAEFVLMEASLMPVNVGCPAFEEVIAFMDRAGFRTFDFCGQGRRRDGILWQVDLLFIRKGSRYQPQASIDRSNWGPGGFF